MSRATNFIIGFMLTVSIVLALVLTMSGCGTVRTVTVTEYKERVVHDTAYQTTYRDRIDSVYVHDTTYIDTAGVQHHNRKEYRSQNTQTRDTIYKTVEVHVVDSIPYEVEVPVEVERPMSTWQRFIYGSGYALWALIAVIIFTLICMGILKLRRVI